MGEGGFKRLLGIQNCPGFTHPIHTLHVVGAVQDYIPAWQPGVRLNRTGGGGDGAAAGCWLLGGMRQRRRGDVSAAGREAEQNRWRWRCSSSRPAPRQHEAAVAAGGATEPNRRRGDGAAAVDCELMPDEACELAE